MIGTELDKYIQQKVKEVLDNDKFPEYDNIHSDTFSELIDKLIIVHIRLWYLEDATNAESNPNKIAELKRKADITFKEKRPMLVKAIDKTITNMCNGKFSPTVENIKAYSGYENETK
tara:strand:+ start:3896 stop:4246 length:351 start_codon:yes stop_codon:yes gene_type:complete